MLVTLLPAGVLPLTGAVISEDAVLQPLQPGFTRYHLASGKDAPAFLGGAATCAAHLTIGGKLTFKDIPPQPFLYSSGSIVMLPVVRLPSLAYGAAPSDPPVAVTAAGVDDPPQQGSAATFSCLMCGYSGRCRIAKD